jgi:hypothetical protein
MSAQEEIAQLKVKIVQLETKLKDYEEQRASCTCIASVPANVSDEAVSRYDTRVRTVQIPSPPLNDVRRSSVPPQSPTPSESAGSKDCTFLHYTPNTYVPGASKKRARQSASSNSSHLPRDTAGRTFILSVKSNKYNTNIVRTPRMDATDPTGSAYDIGTKIAKDTATMLDKSDLANAMASMGLFYFLSSLHVLQQLRMISLDQADELMNHLDAKLNSRSHRRRIRAGAIWFHKKVISIMCSQGWEIGHAIAVVAISMSGPRSCAVMLTVIPDAPPRPYKYDDISCRKNEEPVIEALKSVKDISKRIEGFGWTFFEYVTCWEPSVR